MHLGVDEVMSQQRGGCCVTQLASFYYFNSQNMHNSVNGIERRSCFLYHGNW